MKRWVPVFAATLLMAVLLNPCSPQAATSAADFYKGKIVTMVVTGPPGSGNDLFGRLAAVSLSEITGAKIAVENKTAAGGLVAQNSFYQTAKPDGLTILCEATGRLWPGWLMEEKGINYDITKFEYLSGVRGGPWVLGVSPKGSVNTVDLLKKGKNLKIPSSTSTSIISLAAMGVSEALSLDAKLVIGITSDAAYLAIQQGEAHFMVRNYDNMIRSIQQGQMKALLQLGDERDPSIPDLPTLAELTKLSDHQAKLMDVIFPEAKIFLLPPGTPKDRVQFLDDSIRKMLSNADFQKTIKEKYGAWLGVYTAADSKKNIQYLSAHKNDIKLYTPLITKYVK
jgi:tripartite-type tricarboxylate transporter receptor subunit TctC